MDEYKLSPGFSPIFKIPTIADFERRTMTHEPYWNRNVGEEPSLYAICPICGNPIQMIALYRRTKNSPKAHGRHVAHDISGLAHYNQEAYDFCPYANPNRIPGKDERKKNMDGLPRDIYNLLRDQFDRAVHVLQKELPIFISRALAESMLNDYLATRGHLYVAASLQNLPWMLAYFGGMSRGLVGRFIKEDSPLAKAIADASIPGCLLISGQKPGYLEVASSRGSFLDITFCLIAHELTVKEDVLSETLDFVVNYGKGTSPRCIYRETLQIDPAYFFKLVNLPPERSRRNHDLLALATEKMRLQ